ncbi:hypothetical protein L9F63_009536, partial [Diploptera punctata]
MRQLDRYRRDGRRSSRYFLCTPILGGERRSVAKIKHKPGIDIETRMKVRNDEFLLYFACGASLLMLKYP